MVIMGTFVPHNDQSDSNDHRTIHVEHLLGYWDVKYLRRAIENVAMNAVKYGDPVSPILAAHIQSDYHWSKVFAMLTAEVLQLSRMKRPGRRSL